MSEECHRDKPTHAIRMRDNSCGDGDIVYLLAHEVDGVIISNHPIPSKDFAKWLGVFKTTSGRLIGHPIFCGEIVRVSYEFNDFGDYAVLSDRFDRITVNIVEIERPLIVRAIRYISRRFGIRDKKRRKHERLHSSERKV